MPIQLGKKTSLGTRRTIMKAKLGKKSVMQEFKKPEYHNGGEGMVKFCNDFVFIPIYPPGEVTPIWTPMSDLPSTKNIVTGKSYLDMWKHQQDVLFQALEMRNGRFIHSLIVFCWQRGEGKSVLACLIQIWKAFCFNMQKIVLGANSKDQTKFVHFDIIKDTILYSPKLLDAIGIQNVQEKEVRIRDERGEIVSFIRPISSFSGIMSNITGYTFSEMFDMKNPKFFTQLDGSIRNIPNALGTIDSTVSTKEHILYKLFETFIQKKTTTLFFSHRQSPEADYRDYWNPNMDDKQLKDYQAKFPPNEFGQYFRNTWDAGSFQPFTTEMIDESKIISCDGHICNHGLTKIQVARKHQNLKHMANEGLLSCASASMDLHTKTADLLHNLEKSFTRVDTLYKISPYERCPGSVLTQLTEMLDTDWSILASSDFSDPLSVTTYARTVVSVIAKGLIGSRQNPLLYGSMENPMYIYFLLSLVVVDASHLNKVKDEFDICHEDYNGIDVICCERYGSWDMQQWCDERNIVFEPMYPSYDRQRAMFREFYNAVAQGLYKRPKVQIPGSKLDDIVDEEMAAFIHDTERKWFGSPEKKLKAGVQDDTMFSQGCAIYGGRNLTATDFRIRTHKINFGEFYRPQGLVASY